MKLINNDKVTSLEHYKFYDIKNLDLFRAQKE
jgi:hypothetical protein